MLDLKDMSFFFFLKVYFASEGSGHRSRTTKLRIIAYIVLKKKTCLLTIRRQITGLEGGRIRREKERRELVKTNEGRVG